LARRFFRAAAAPIRQAWQLSANGDLSLPEIDGTPTLLVRLFNVYIDRVLTAAEYDNTVVNQFVRVTSLVDPATRLLRPSIIWRAARADHRQRRHVIDSHQAAGVLADSGPVSPADAANSAVSLSTRVWRARGLGAEISMARYR
jgi:hypothetical protein